MSHSDTDNLLAQARIRRERLINELRGNREGCYEKISTPRNLQSIGGLDNMIIKERIERELRDKEKQSREQILQETGSRWNNMP
jgi:hypothetical protein